MRRSNGNVGRRSWLLIGALAVVLGCGDSANTQYVPIGSRCGSNSDCGTKPYNCVTAGHPGGYCQKDCSTDGDCPTDAICISGECRRKCGSTSDCRSSEGYQCIQAALSYCDVP